MSRITGLVSIVADKHQMVLSGRSELGAEEWACPRCGRRLLLRWPPQPEKLVLEQGDVTAIHVGGKGGVQAGGITAAAVPASAERQRPDDTGAERQWPDITGIDQQRPDDPGADRQWLDDNGIDWDGTSA
jgi:hypothetical protein